MKITPLQESFSSGEISPKLYGRTGSPGYQSGVAVMENFIADARGPAIRRLGTAYIATINFNSGRVFAFPVSESTYYIFVAVDNLFIPLHSDGAPVTTNYVQNARFRENNLHWTEAATQGAITYEPDSVTLQNNDHPNAETSIGQQVVVPNTTDPYVISVHSLTSTPFRVRVGNAFEDGSYDDRIIPGGSENYTITVPAVNPWITVTNETPDSESIVTAIGFLSTVDVSSIATPWLETDLPELHGFTAPGGRIVYFTHKNHPTQKLEYSYEFDTFTFTEVAFIDPPATWADSNYPRTGTFHEGRLWLAGTPAEPETFWGSKSGDYENFTLGSLADDALQFTIAEEGVIRWMQSTKNLLIGTGRGEHIVTSVEGVITPGDIQVTQQSSYGSSAAQSRQVGDQIFYVSPDGRKIRAMQYEWTADNWLSQDVTFFSDHISQPKINFTSWIQNPNNLFGCVLDDGTMALLTYERSENIYGWFTVKTEGTFIDITSVPIDGSDVLVALIQRVDGTLYVERMRASKRNYSDSWVERIVQPDNTVIGLDHLEGELVQVLADGAVQTSQTVTGGQITLEYPATNAVVGLQYISTMQTLPFDRGSQTGSGQPYMKRYNKLIVTLLDSANPIINGIRQPSRTPPTPMNTVQPIDTHRAEIYNLGWDKEAVVTIEQDLPLPCTVISIAGEMGQEIL